MPSMHICFSFIPELLSITSNERRINLLVQLARTYSIPKTLDLCRLALRCGLALAMTLVGGELCSFFVNSIDAFVTMAATFPPLSALCVELLETMKRLSRHESQLRLDAEHEEYDERDEFLMQSS